MTKMVIDGPRCPFCGLPEGLCEEHWQERNPGLRRKVDGTLEPMADVLARAEARPSEIEQKAGECAKWLRAVDEVDMREGPDAELTRATQALFVSLSLLLDACQGEGDGERWKVTRKSE